MATPKPPRRVPAGAPRRPEPSPEPTPEVSAAPPPAEAPPTSEAPAGRLDLSDLEALAQMSPDELASLMEGSSGGVRLEPGAKVEGTVTRVGHDTVFVDLGGKSEGLLDRSELPDASAGDSVEAFVVRAGENGTILTVKLTGQAAAEHLAEAAESGLPVEGRVEGRNPGGFNVKVGPVRAFCPASQMTTLRGVDPDGFIGQVLEFRVLEAGDRVVLSRRALQEEEAARKAEILWKTLAVDQQHRGTVTSVQPFGFFVDIGGVEGLVPRSEIGWGHTDDPHQAVRVGQAVEVAVIRADREQRKLTLSAKALEDDPWNAVGSGFVEGGVYGGKVTNTADFGAFVQLAPGLEGLVHVSKLPGGLPEKGSSIDVRLLQIDHERRRLSLAPVEAGAESIVAGATELSGTVVEVKPGGVVVQLEDGRSGWLPAGEVDLPAGTVLAQRFRRGRTITARVTADDPRRVTLSMREDAREAQRSWRVHQAQQGSGGGFGTLGELLGGLKFPEK